MVEEMPGKIFSFIANFEEQNGYPPVMREIAGKFLISLKEAYQYCRFLEMEKLIETEYEWGRIVRIKKDV